MCFPLTVNYAFFFMWSYLDVQKFIQLMLEGGAAVEDVAPTLNVLHPLFNVRKIAYSPFF